MQSLPIEKAEPGTSYHAANGDVITVLGPSENAPGWIDVESATGRTIKLPPDYQVRAIEAGNGINLSALVFQPREVIEPVLGKLTTYQLDELVTRDPRMWVVSVVTTEQERRAAPAEDTSAETILCPVCLTSVGQRPSASRGGSYVLAVHKPQSGPGLCAGASRTAAEALGLRDQGARGLVGSLALGDTVELRLFRDDVATDIAWPARIAYVDDARAVSADWTGDEWGPGTDEDPGGKVCGLFSISTGVRAGDSADDDKRAIRLIKVLARAETATTPPVQKSARAACPVCTKDVALCKGGELRDHKPPAGIDLRMPVDTFGACPGAGWTVLGAQSRLAELIDDVPQVPAHELRREGDPQIRAQSGPFDEPLAGVDGYYAAKQACGSTGLGVHTAKAEHVIHKVGLCDFPPMLAVAWLTERAGKSRRDVLDAIEARLSPLPIDDELRAQLVALEVPLASSVQDADEPPVADVPPGVPSEGADEPPVGDLFAGATSGPDRVERVKSWPRDRCLNAAIRANAGDLTIQAAVRREIERQLAAFDKVLALDAAKISGRNGLVKLRRLKTIARRPGVVTLIDHLLSSTMIEGGAEAAADATVVRVVGEPDGDPEIPEALARWLHLHRESDPALRSLDKITLCTIAALTGTVRSSREAAKATTDAPTVLIAWRYASDRPDEPTTLIEGLASRYRALTGELPDGSDNDGDDGDPVVVAPPEEDHSDDVPAYETGTPITSTPEVSRSEVGVVDVDEADEAELVDWWADMVADVRAGTPWKADVVARMWARLQAAPGFVFEQIEGERAGMGAWIAVEPTTTATGDPRPAHEQTIVGDNHTAINAGSEARHAGVPLSDNPHDVDGADDGTLAKMWETGWRDADAALAPVSPEPVRVQVRDLQIVSKPDGTEDLWACPAGEAPRHIGPTTSPQLAPVVAKVRALAAAPNPCAPSAPSGSIAQHFAALGTALQGLHEAGIAVELTIQVGGAS